MGCSASAATAAALGLAHLIIVLLAQVSGDVHVGSDDVNNHTVSSRPLTDAQFDQADSSIVGGALALTALTTKAPARFDDVRPVTLSSEWSRMARLLLISALSVVGSIGNVFMVSSVMIEDHLKKAGNFNMIAQLQIYLPPKLPPFFFLYNLA